MKAFVCIVCGFNSIDGTKPETCPVCMNKTFDEKENAIMEPEDAANLNELEKKHIPVVNVAKECKLIPEDCQDVNVKIGEIVHPMQDDHFIVFIDFYLDKKWITRVQLSPNVKPGAALHLPKLSGQLAVIEKCNKHGAWIKETEL